MTPPTPLEVAREGSPEQSLRDLRVRSLYTPYFFIKVVLGFQQLVDHLHLVDTELFVNRWADGHRLQWIEWPRGFFKTTCFTIGTGIWVVLPVTDADSRYAIDVLKIPEADWFKRVSLHDQDATQLYAFETLDNARKKVSIVRRIFEEYELFRTLFPEIAYSGKEQPWNDNGLMIRRAGRRRSDAEGTFDAIGVGGALQSRHYKIVWCDDLVGIKAVESPSVMNKTIEWFQLLGGAFEQLSQQIRFGVSNQWSFADLNAWVKENDKDFIFHTRSAWTIGPDGSEVATFPERMDMDAIRREQKKWKPHLFAAQYMNAACLPGEQEASAALVHRYKVDEWGHICCNCGYRVHPRNLIGWMHYDPYNAKGVASSSRPAIANVGTSVDRHVFLLDYYVARESYGKIFDKLIEKNDRWQPYLFTYEDVGAQNMSEFYIRERERTAEFREAKHRRFPRIKPMKTGNKIKERRIRDHFLQRIEQGLKFSCRDEHMYFIQQLERFPHPQFDHDYDLLDCLAQGALVWRYPVDETAETKKKKEEDELLEKLGTPYSYAEGR